MAKDKKKRDKEDKPDLDKAKLEGMVRVRAVLRKYGVSSQDADLTTEALDKMVSEAVSEVGDRLEKKIENGIELMKEATDDVKKALKDTTDKAQDKKMTWLLTIISVAAGAITIMLGILTFVFTFGKGPGG